MRTIYIGLLIFFIAPFHSSGKELDIFFIRRSKNKNEVQYRINVDKDCQLKYSDPISGIWKILEDGQNKTESLSAFDRLAYGTEIQEVTKNWVYFNLKAIENKLIRATAIFDSEGDQCWPISQVKINEKWALLDYIFVSSEEGLLIPKVIYIDIFGKSLGFIPKRVTERIKP